MGTGNKWVPKMNRKREQDRREVDMILEHSTLMINLPCRSARSGHISWKCKLWSCSVFLRNLPLFIPFLILVVCYSAEDLERVFYYLVKMEQFLDSIVQTIFKIKEMADQLIEQLLFTELKIVCWPEYVVSTAAYGSWICFVILIKWPSRESKFNWLPEHFNC